MAPHLVRSGRYVTVNLSNVHSSPSSSHFMGWNCHNGLPQNCIVVVPFARNCSPSFKCQNKSFRKINYHHASRTLSFELRIDLGEDKARLAEVRFSLWTKIEGIPFLTSEVTVPLLIRCSKDDNTTLTVEMPTPSPSFDRKRNREEGEEGEEEELLEAKRQKSEEKDSEPSSPLNDNVGSPVHFSDNHSSEPLNVPVDAHFTFDAEIPFLEDNLTLGDLSLWDSEVLSSLLNGFLPLE